jgi:excisionase family DNA binding protein
MISNTPTLYRWTRERRIAHYRVAKRLVFRLADLEAFIERQRVDARTN